MARSLLRIYHTLILLLHASGGCAFMAAFQECYTTLLISGASQCDGLVTAAIGLPWQGCMAEGLER